MNYLDNSLLDNQDFLYLLSSRLDNQSLEVLSRTPLWNQISRFAQDQYFWYLRAQYLVSRDLKFKRDADWKRIYYLLIAREEWMIGGFTGTFGVGGLLYYPPAMEVFLELGDDPSVHSSTSLATASKLGLEDAVRLLLSDPRIDPTAEDSKALAKAIAWDRYNVVKLLLEDGRIISKYGGHENMNEAVTSNEGEDIFKLLREDRRFLKIYPELREYIENR